MNYVKPCFYDRFRCSASACTDTCCAGWEIDIDPDTAAYYATLPGPLGEKLQEVTATLEDGTQCFQLDAEERCPFLNEDNLCELILALGDNALCEICREHPRFYEQIGDRMEMGVGLCCEEACRLLFAETQPLSFITTTLPGLPDMLLLPDSGMQVYKLRDEAFRMVQDRTLPLRVRIHRLIDFGLYAQKQLCGQPAPAETTPPAEDDPDTREALFQLMESLEPYDESWPENVRLLNDPTLVANPDEIDGGYENLLVYFLYRHFVHGCIDGYLSARVLFCVVSVWFICLMNTRHLEEDGEFTPWQRILDTKDYSKQVEYSDINLETMLEAFHNNPAFSGENIKKLFG